MNNKVKLIAGFGVSAVAILCLLAGIFHLNNNLQQQKKENADMQRLAELDRKEMEDEYTRFSNQYGEMKSQITNDSIAQQLEREQQRTQELLNELKRTKNTDAAEITRLKKELQTVRAVMRGYILQIDSLNRLNQALTQENKQVKEQMNVANQTISNLTTEKASLSDKVAIAAQLDATNISVLAKNRKGKEAKKIKDVTRLAISFTITKNITAATGERTIYVRITKPTNEVLGKAGTFHYENTQLDYTIKKVIEYTGEEQSATVYWDVQEFLSAGTYHVYIFADGNMIGSRAITLD